MDGDTLHWTVEQRREERKEILIVISVILNTSRYINVNTER